MPLSIDDQNSSTFLLSANETFTGIKSELLGKSDAFTGISVVIYSNTNSSPEGLSVQFSDDGIVWETYFQDIYIAPMKFKKTYQIISKQFYRITYKNGTTAQTAFSLISSLTTLTDTNVIVNFNPNMIDAFGRLKISNASTLVDMRVYKYGIASNPQIIVTKSTGTYTGTVSNSTVNLSGTGIGSYVSQSRKYCIFGGNKGIEVIAVGAMNNGGVNTSTCYSRIGYFDGNDGWFFEFNSVAGISINVKSSITSTTGIIPRSLWNVDRMDGTGPSGINLNFAGRQSFVIQVSNIINFGFQVNGTTYYCHVITPLAPVVSIPPVASLNLPIRYEISGLGVGDSGSMLQGAAVAMAWAGFEQIGRPFSANTSVTGVVMSDTEFPILAITGNVNYIHQNILPMCFSSMYVSTTVDTVLIKLRLYMDGNQITTGTTVWTDVNTQSCMKYSHGTNILGVGTLTTTNSNVVYSCYLQKGTVGSVDLKSVFNSLVQLTSNVDNISDVLLITGQASSNPPGMDKIYTTIEWQEIY